MDVWNNGLHFQCFKLDAKPNAVSWEALRL